LVKDQLWKIAFFYQLVHDYESAKKIVYELQKDYLEKKDTINLVKCKMSLASLFLFQNEPDSTLQYIDYVNDYIKTSFSNKLIINNYLLQAKHSQYIKDYKSANNLLVKALDYVVEKEEELQVLSELANNEIIQKRYAQSIVYYNKIIERFCFFKVAYFAPIISILYWSFSSSKESFNDR